jgi:hypothetical protein
MTIRDMISDSKRTALLAMARPVPVQQGLVRLACGDSVAMDAGDEALARITGSALCGTCGTSVRLA